MVKLLEEKNGIDEDEAWLELEEFLAKLINGNVVEVEAER